MTLKFSSAIDLAQRLDPRALFHWRQNSERIVAGSQSEDLRSLVARMRAEIVSLCAELEHLADSLQQKGARQRCLMLARSIAPTVVRCHRFEEDVLFPALLEISKTTADLEATIETLRGDHLEDECFAEELQDALLGYGSGSTTLSADAMGYMLRSFFLAERRHMAYEAQVLRLLKSDDMSAAKGLA
jgi:hypothetical protein